MKIINASRVSMAITDLQLAGVSVLPAIRALMLTSGALEDDDDLVTLLPGESLTASADWAMWIEGLEYL